MSEFVDDLLMYAFGIFISMMTGLGAYFTASLQFEAGLFVSVVVATYFASSTGVFFGLIVAGISLMRGDNENGST